MPHQEHPPTDPPAGAGRGAPTAASMPASRVAAPGADDPIQPVVEDVSAGAAALSEREARLERREAELRSLANEHEAERSRLDAAQLELKCRQAELEDVAAQRAELEQRRVSVDQLYLQASQFRARAEEHRSEVETLRRELAEREAELANSTLQLEVDRQQLEADRAALVQEREQVHARASELDAQRAALKHLAKHGRTAQSQARSARLPVARTITLSSLLGLAAAVVFFTLNAPRTRSTLELEYTGERTADTHTHTLLSRTAVSAYLPDVRKAAAWRAALARTLVTADAPPPRALRITLVGPDSAANETLLRDVCNAYAAYIVGRPLAGEDVPRWRAWNRRHEALLAERATLIAERNEIAERREALPETHDWDAAQAALSDAQSQLDTARADFAAEREKLYALQAQDTPRGTVAAEQFAEALLRDAVYQEDRKEFASHAHQYRSELVLAMVLMLDPLRDARQTLRGFSDVLREQIDLSPPFRIRAVLEKAAVALDDLERLVAEFTRTWDDRRLNIERLTPADQVVELVKEQTVSFEAVGRIAAELPRVLELLRGNFDALTGDPDSGTRANVVAAVLRGEAARLAEAAAAVSEAAAQLDLAHNFKLDAADRQIRNLRARLKSRRDRIGIELQERADREAKTAHEEARRNQLDRVAALDQRRDDLLAELLEHVANMRRIEQSSRALVETNAELDANRAAVQRIDTRLDALASEEPTIAPDQIALGAIEHVQMESPRRARDAGIAGAAVFAATWLLAGLLFMRPRR